MSTSTHTLMQLLARKCELLTQLRGLGDAQAATIATGDLGTLIKVLAAKQQLLDAVHQTERGLDPFRNETPHERAWQNAEDRRRCHDLNAACEALLGDIVAGEKHSEHQLRLRRDEAAEQLNAVHFASKARGEYASAEIARESSFDIQTP